MQSNVTTNAPILRATTLRSEAFRAIRTEIISGRLAPGTKLVESDLAQRLGVSRNPIREAIGKLEQQGLVVLIPNRGTFVVQPTPEQAHDMFLLRAYLELLAVRLAYVALKPDTFAPLGEVVAAMTNLAANSQQLDGEVFGQFSLLDTEFHTRLVQASENTALLRAWETSAPTDIIFLHDRMLKRPRESDRDELDGMAGRHDTLLQKLQSGDLHVAQAGLKTHFMPVSRKDTISLDEASLELLG